MDFQIFRGLSVDNKEWVYGNHLETNDSSYIVEEAEASCIDGENTDLYALKWSKVIPETVGFSVEINGNQYFDGDIIHRKVTIVVYETDVPPEDIDEYLKVEYRNEYGGFYIGERSLLHYIDTNWDVDTGCRCTLAKVVGNVYQNPELLGAQTNE